jgi:hypothetical protein
MSDYTCYNFNNLARTGVFRIRLLRKLTGNFRHAIDYPPGQWIIIEMPGGIFSTFPAGIPGRDGYKFLWS